MLVVLVTGGKQSQLLVQLTWTVRSGWTGDCLHFQSGLHFEAVSIFDVAFVFEGVFIFEVLFLFKLFFFFDAKWMPNNGSCDT